MDYSLIGSSEFDDYLDIPSALFIDKTLFIKEFMAKSATVSLFLRPRRFGKSFNLTMLKCFLSFGANPSSFDKYEIGKEKEFVKEHCGKYPVVYLDLNQLHGVNWESMKGRLWTALCEMVYRHKNELPDYTLLFWKTIAGNETHEPMSEAKMETVLKRLTLKLHEKHQKKVIVLIDESDAPLNIKSYYEQAATFFVGFNSNALKGNEALRKACLMGIVELKGKGILSGLNNVATYAINDKCFSEYFGFTKDEVGRVLNSVGKIEYLDKVKSYYHGYQIGESSVYNSWTMVFWLHKFEFKNYWVDSGSIDTLSTFIAPHMKFLLGELATLITRNESLTCDLFSTSVNYSNVKWDRNSIFHFLLCSGYLTFDGNFSSVRIPNEEVKRGWLKCLMPLIADSQVVSSLSAQVQTAFNDGNLNAIHDFFKQVLYGASFYDLTKRNEYCYHLLIFGLFFAAFPLSERGSVQVLSNMEFGDGRADIVVELLKQKKVFEFKVSKTMARLKPDAQLALEQIVTKDYTSPFKYANYNIWIIGASFCKEKVSENTHFPSCCKHLVYIYITQ